MPKWNYVRWVVAIDHGQGARCERCGKEIRLKLPMPVAVWCAAMKEFVKLHKYCPAPAAVEVSRHEAKP